MPLQWTASGILTPDVGASDYPREAELVLGAAINTYAQRIAELVERERTFTRDASHELRSPLTVIKVATDLLLADEGHAGSRKLARRHLERIRKATRDMEALLEAFLILARDAESGLPAEDFLVNMVLREELERAQPLLKDKPVDVRLEEHCQLLLHAPAKAVGLVLGNLVRNAFQHTASGQVTALVGPDGVRIVDTGSGMMLDPLHGPMGASERSGPARNGGVGLSVVRRLSDRFGWPVRFESMPDRGTMVSIGFPQARTQG